MRQRNIKRSGAPHGWRPLREDRGIVLVLSLLVLMILSILGSAFLLLSGTEVTISRNSQVVTQTFYAAEAGIETALNNLPGTAAIPQTALGASAVFQTGPPPPQLPKKIKELGPSANPPGGFNLASFSFNMYQIDVTGTVLLPRSDAQLQLGATLGTPLAGSSYN